MKRITNLNLAILLATLLAGELHAKYHDDESDLIYYGYRYCNPTTGRWLSRDPIGERGGLPLYGFCGNAPVSQIDALGLDYILVITKGAKCGVDHHEMWGDDGNGKHYKVELVPVTKTFWSSYRRICGKGTIQHKPGHGSLDDEIGRSAGEISEVIKRVSTTPVQDAALAAAAVALDGKEVTYCLGLQDCRAIEGCVVRQSLGKGNLEQLQKLLNDVIDASIHPFPKK